MNTLVSVDNVESIMRTELIIQSELADKFVRNALSYYGTDLDKVLSEQIYTSIETTDNILLFELKSRQNETDMSETNNDDSITYYRSYELYLILYGDKSTDLANKIIARFRTENVRQRLSAKGIYIQRIDEPERINEYKNEVMWIRNDISMLITCKFSIEPITVDTDFESTNINLTRR